MNATEPATSSSRTLWFIYCQTGCSCCRRENHYTGPWSSEALAQAAAAGYEDTKRLASQWAPNGEYSIEEKEAEVLPDGRLIIGGTVLDPDEYPLDDGCQIIINNPFETF